MLVYHADECPVVNVAAFFRDSLKGMKGLEETSGAGMVTFKFETADGVPMMILVSPQEINRPDGPSEIEIHVNP